MEYKSRSGYTVFIEDDYITLKKPMGLGTIHFNKSVISEVIIKPSIYDLPFFETTVVIRLVNKKKYAIKRLPRKSAKEIYNLLTR